MMGMITSLAHKGSVRVVNTVVFCLCCLVGCGGGSNSNDATTTVTLSGTLRQADPTTTLPESPNSAQEINGTASFVTIVPVYDASGARHSVTLAFSKLQDHSWISQAFVDGGEISGTTGVPVEVGRTSLGFSVTGQIVDPRTQINATINFDSTSAPSAITFDLSGFSESPDLSSLTSITSSPR